MHKKSMKSPCITAQMSLQCVQNAFSKNMLSYGLLHLSLPEQQAKRRGHLSVPFPPLVSLDAFFLFRCFLLLNGIVPFCWLRQNLFTGETWPGNCFVWYKTCKVGLRFFVAREVVHPYRNGTLQAQYERMQSRALKTLLYCILLFVWFLLFHETLKLIYTPDNP